MLELKCNTSIEGDRILLALPYILQYSLDDLHYELPIYITVSRMSLEYFV